MKPLISVIIPVYNAEKYLQRCVDSVLSQTFTNIECILVDDGSSDNSPTICDEYAEKDKRIVVIHKENAGEASARNAGLDVAKGEYIGFVDSDDWCDVCMFHVLYENAIKYDSDVSICGYKVVVDGKTRSSHANYDYKLRLLNKEQAILGIFLQGSFGGFSWNKLVKAEIFSKNELRYATTINYMLDVLFFWELFKHIERAVYFPAPYYNYFQHSASVTNLYGLTEQAKTAFVALDKMISLESCAKIKDKIILAKTLFALNLCLHYIKKDDCANDDFYFLKKIVSYNITYLLLDCSVSLRQKILCFLVFFPRIYHICCLKHKEKHDI